MFTLKSSLKNRKMKKSIAKKRVLSKTLTTYHSSNVYQIVETIPLKKIICPHYSRSFFLERHGKSQLWPKDNPLHFCNLSLFWFCLKICDSNHMEMKEINSIFNYHNIIHVFNLLYVKNTLLNQVNVFFKALLCQKCL